MVKTLQNRGIITSQFMWEICYVWQKGCWPHPKRVVWFEDLVPRWFILSSIWQMELNFHFPSISWVDLISWFLMFSTNFTTEHSGLVFHHFTKMKTPTKWRFLPTDFMKLIFGWLLHWMSQLPLFTCISHVSFTPKTQQSSYLYQISRNIFRTPKGWFRTPKG